MDNKRHFRWDRLLLLIGIPTLGFILTYGIWWVGLKVDNYLSKYNWWNPTYTFPIEHWGTGFLFLIAIVLVLNIFIGIHFLITRWLFTKDISEEREKEMGKFK